MRTAAIQRTVNLKGLWCSVWGHHVDNHRFHDETGRARHCRCGERYLEKQGEVTRVGHTLSCFLGHHTYRRLIDRDGYHEYVCVQCGHPLMFEADSDPYAQSTQFQKKVRYLCGVFGHRVKRVTARDGFTEYACFCGHSFLRTEPDLSLIRHPSICVTAGHWIRYVTDRSGFSEYVCVNCGHPFCFEQ